MSKEEIDVKTLNIHQRILGVMDDVRYLQKNDKAAKGLPYKFISHDQVTGELHEAFVKWRIVNTCTVKTFKQEGNRTEVVLQISFINADTPEDRFVIESFGYGIDPQDKGPGKAISYAYKMACLKTFMLETGDDPEKDNIDFKEDEVLTIAQQRDLVQILEKLNDPYYESIIVKRHEIENLSKLKAKDYDKVMIWLKSIENKGAKK